MEKRKYAKEYYVKNRTRIIESNLRYYYNNKEQISLQRKEYREKNKEKILEQKKEYFSRSEVKEERKIYEAKNKIRFQKRKRDYMKIYMNSYIKNRRNDDLNYSIGLRLRALVNKALKKYSQTGKIMSSQKYKIDYEKIIDYLKPFPKNIQNYHVDHMIPLSSFDLNKSEEIKKAFAPENHQWLTVEENLKKSNKII